MSVTHSTLFHDGTELAAPELRTQHHDRWLVWIDNAQSHVAAYVTADEADAIAESWRTLADEIRDREEAHE